MNTRKQSRLGLLAVLVSSLVLVIWRPVQAQEGNPYGDATNAAAMYASFGTATLGKYTNSVGILGFRTGTDPVFWNQPVTYIGNKCWLTTADFIWWAFYVGISDLQIATGPSTGGSPSTMYVDGVVFNPYFSSPYSEDYYNAAVIHVDGGCSNISPVGLYTGPVTNGTHWYSITWGKFVAASMGTTVDDNSRRGYEGIVDFTDMWWYGETNYVTSTLDAPGTGNWLPYEGVDEAMSGGPLLLKVSNSLEIAGMNSNWLGNGLHDPNGTNYGSQQISYVLPPVVRDWVRATAMIAPPRPFLTIIPQGAGCFLLSWPSADTGGFVVQVSHDLHQALWSTVDVLPTDDGMVKSVALQFNDPESYWRLAYFASRPL